MSTEQRLLEYYDFNPSVVDAVSEVAERQRRATYQELADEYGLSDGPQRLGIGSTRHSVEYLELTPKTDFDETHARVLYSPMGIPVDANMGIRAIRLFAADPSERLLVVGSPATAIVARNNANLVRRHDLLTVATGDLRPAVRSGFAAIQSRYRLSSVDTLGYSYGADAGASAATVAADYDTEAKRGVWVESAADKQRTLRELAKDFWASGRFLNEYVERADSLALIQARKESKNDVGYFAGLTRLSNIAIANCLARGGFSMRVAGALRTQETLRATIGWGTSSELTFTAGTRGVVRDATAEFGSERVHQLPLYNMHHTGGDDIDLHAAIMLQGLRAVSQ